MTDIERRIVCVRIGSEKILFLRKDSEESLA